MKKFFGRAAYVVVPIAILFFVVLLNWQPMSNYVLKNVAQFYAGRADIALNIERISGNPFSESTIDKITIRPVKADSQIYSFKADSISCTYNLWDLREGYEFFLEGLSCSVSTPEFSYDFRIAALQDNPPGESKKFLLPAVLPKLEVQNGTVILINAEWGAEIIGINSSLQAAEGVQELQIETENFRFHQGESIRIETGFSAMLRSANAKVTLDSFEMGEQKISATGFIDLAQIEKGHTGFAADLAFAESSLKIEGSIDNLFLKTHASIENFDISELQKRLGGSEWDISGKIRGKTDLAYNLESGEDLNGSFDLRIQDGQMHAVDVEAVSLVGSFDNNNLNVSLAEAHIPGNDILFREISIPMQLLKAGEVLPAIAGSRGKFSVDIADFETFLQIIKVEEDQFPVGFSAHAVKISGNGYLEKGVMYFEDAKVLTSDSTLSINQAIIPIPTTVETFESVPINLAARLESSNIKGLAGLFDEIPVSGQLAVDMSFKGSIKESHGKIALSGENLLYKELGVGDLALQGELRVIQEKPGKIKSLHFTIAELEQTNNSGTIKLVTPAIATWKQDAFSLDSAFQIDGQGEVDIEIAKEPEKEIAAEIVLRDLNSNGWLESFIDSRYFFHGADIKAVFTGLLNKPQLHVEGSISEFGDTGVPFPLTGSFSLQYSSKGIEVSEFTWKSHGKNELTLTGYLPYDPLAEEPFLDGDLSLKGHIDFPSLEDVAGILEPWGIGKGSVELDMDVNGSWDHPEGHILIEAEDIASPERLRQYMDSVINLSCDITAQNKAIYLKSANLDARAYSAQATGSWKHGVSVKKFLQNRKAELKGELAADATVQMKDLNFLRNRMPWLRRIEGDMQGEIHVSGPVTKPSLKGSFSLKDGEMSHTFNFPMLSAVNLQSDFDERSLTINNMKAEVGGAPLNLSGNIIKEKDSAVLNLHVDGKNILLFRNNDIRMRGDVQLDVSGPLQRLVVKGTTGLTGGYYTGNIDFLGKIGSSTAPVSKGASFLFSFQDPPLKNAVLDIKVTTIEPFRVRNNLIRGVLRPELSLKGTGELPFLIGTVYIDPSRVLLPSGRLQIQSGLLRFLEGKPDRPNLDLIAHSKVLGYDINVVTQGPLDDPVITLSSSPALSNEELLLLLLTGQPPKADVAGGAKSSGTTNVMVYLGRDFLSRWLETESSEESILDRFELDYGRGVTKTGEQTVEASFLLSEEESGKRKVYYLSGEKDKYDAYNYGLKLVFRFD